MRSYAGFLSKVFGFRDLSSKFLTFLMLSWYSKPHYRTQRDCSFLILQSILSCFYRVKYKHGIGLVRKTYASWINASNRIILIFVLFICIQLFYLHVCKLIKSVERREAVQQTNDLKENRINIVCSVILRENTGFPNISFVYYYIILKERNEIVYIVI